MSLVLAVEPDRKQAEILRHIVGRQAGAQLVLVTSAYAAAVVMNRAVPDLVLLGASLDQNADAHVVDHFILASDAPEPQTLRIPADASSDPDAFGAAIAAGLARAAQWRRDRATPDAPESVSESGEDISIDVDSASVHEMVDPEVHAAQLATVQAQAEARLASELERVRNEAAEQRAAELARLQMDADAQLRAEVSEARAAAAADARNALTAELANARREAEQTLSTELARVRAEAAQRLADQLRDADALRSAAVEQARLDAEQTARLALDAEVARIKADTDARLAVELRRVHDEGEQARLTQEQTDAAAARAVAAEVARVRAESDARLEAELSRARQDAEQARLAQQQAQVDVEAIREAAARDAHTAAEAAAARALETEIERVRAEADARLREELGRVQAEVERTRDAQHRAQIDAAAARAREAEAARADAESRLRTELERVRQETDRARLADQSEMNRVIGDAEREVRARADALLQAEIARARADANAHLASEVAAVRAAGERRRVAELAVISAELDQMREAARTQAYSAATQAVSAEVARAEISIPQAVAQMAAHAGSQTVSATAAVVSMTIRGIGRGGSAALPVARRVVDRLSAQTIAVAAALLLVIGGLAFVDVSSLTSTGASLARSARSASGTAVVRLGTTAQRVQAAFRSNDAPTATVRPAPAVDGTPGTPATPATPAAAGLLTVSSRVPLDLYVSGRRIGATDEGQIVLAPGRYQVGLVSTALNYRGEVTIDIRSGALTSHTVPLPNGMLQVDTEPGAEVWIEGERAGVSPLGAVPVAIGARDILVRHPDLGERREFVEVRYGEVTPLSISLREARVPPADAFPLPPGRRVP